MSTVLRPSTISSPEIRLTGGTLIRASVRRVDEDLPQEQTKRFHHLMQDAMRTLPSEYVIAHDDD